MTENLIHDPHVYVDDLVSDSASRSSGHGGALLDFLKAEAKALGCDQLVLDTGIANVNAQRFYQNAGLAAEGVHFYIRLS